MELELDSVLVARRLLLASKRSMRKVLPFAA